MLVWTDGLYCQPGQHGVKSNESQYDQQYQYFQNGQHCQHGQQDL